VVVRKGRKSKRRLGVEEPGRDGGRGDRSRGRQ
jgi:hypothetical protein